MVLDYIAIGKRIRYFRKQKCYTQQILAELSEQEPSNISHIERGATKLGLPTIVKIANALEVTVDDLLCDNVTRSKYVFEKQIHELISECTDSEIRVICPTIRTLKEALRKSAHK